MQELDKNNILFICIENVARSQMAEGFAKQYVSKTIGIFSAGINPSSNIHPMAVDTMRTYDIDISHQKPKSIEDIANFRFDLIITLCQQAMENCPTFAGSPTVVHWNLPDPAKVQGSDSQIKKAFADSAAKIRSLVSDLFQRGYLDAFLQQKITMDSILNSLSDGIVAHDLKRKIFYFSENAAKLTGLSPSSVIGKDCHDVFQPRLCGDNCSFCNEDFISDLQPKNYETVFYDTKGIRKELEISVLPLKGLDDNLKGVLASLQDATYRKSLDDIEL